MQERLFTDKEVEAMCSQAYMRGMMVQYNAANQNEPMKVSKDSFSEWVKKLIKECPFNKFV